MYGYTLSGEDLAVLQLRTECCIAVDNGEELPEMSSVSSGDWEEYNKYLGRGKKNSGRWTHLVSWPPPALGTWSPPDPPWRRTSPSSWPTVRSTWRQASRSWGTVPTCPSFLRCSRRTWESREDEIPSRSCDCWGEGGYSQPVLIRQLPERSKRLIEWREEIHDRASLLLRLGRKFPVTSLNSIFFHC